MNTNEKLKKIFDRKNFRYGDIVEWNGDELTIIEVTEWYDKGFKVAVFADPIIRNISILTIEKLESITLIQPAVGLSDVLVKMNTINAFCELKTYDIANGQNLMWINEHIIWQLGKDLWLQSDKTKKFIAEILE